MGRSHLSKHLLGTARIFSGMLPILIGVLLLASLVLELTPMDRVATWFGRSVFGDSLVGAALGSVAAGNPIASYLLAGELVAAGISLAAATGLIISWVTVGLAQLPAEALTLGWRFALLRNLVCFVLSVAAAFLTVSVLKVLG